PREGVVTLDAAVSGQTLEIKVIDQGRGIPEKLQSVIFEPFEQVEKADASEKKGTGLGLFIVKSIVESHNGEIGVQSEEGKGACFWIRLPIAADVQKKDLVQAMSN
ncbi:MAG: ATP-binding protein, partial [Candidatus Obscuribacterales bacterium]|nr:ATP-binding protein [Candidatus Obscuribacterales bacterium]